MGRKDCRPNLCTLLVLLLCVQLVFTHLLYAIYFLDRRYILSYYIKWPNFLGHPVQLIAEICRAYLIIHVRFPIYVIAYSVQCTLSVQRLPIPDVNSRNAVQTEEDSRDGLPFSWQIKFSHSVCSGTK